MYIHCIHYFEIQVKTPFYEIYANGPRLKNFEKLIIHVAGSNLQTHLIKLVTSRERKELSSYVNTWYLRDIKILQVSTLLNSHEGVGRKHLTSSYVQVDEIWSAF